MQTGDPKTSTKLIQMNLFLLKEAYLWISIITKLQFLLEMYFPFFCTNELCLHLAATTAFTFKNKVQIVLKTV